MGIKIKKKICCECKKKTYIFSKGRCKPCASREYRETEIENKRIKNQSERKVGNYKQPKINFRSEKGNKKANQDSKFFRKIWETRPHISEVSGEHLGDEYNPVFMSHVISKGAYPKARYWEENIMLKTFEEHKFYETGDPMSKEYKTMFKEVLKRKAKLIIRYYR